MHDADTISELMTRKEPLLPILRPYIVSGGFGLMLNHPLVQEIMYHEQMNALINKRYTLKAEALAEAVKNNRWSQVIWYHERPWRIDVLLKYGKQMPDRVYWESVGCVWTDSENIWQNYDHWRTLWENPRPGRKWSMESADRRRLALLPDLIKVYRGVGGMGMSNRRRRKPGMSWTTDRDKAEWFANRWKQTPATVLEGRVEKSDVHAFFNSRDESEIVSTQVKVKS